jgi:hypothetical protein
MLRVESLEERLAPAILSAPAPFDGHHGAHLIAGLVHDAPGHLLGTAHRGGAADAGRVGESAVVSHDVALASSHRPTVVSAHAGSPGHGRTASKATHPTFPAAADRADASPSATVALWQSSGLSEARFAHRHHISLKTLRSWVAQAQHAPPAAPAPTTATAPSAAGAPITLTVNSSSSTAAATPSTAAATGPVASSGSSLVNATAVPSGSLTAQDQNANPIYSLAQAQSFNTGPVTVPTVLTSLDTFFKDQYGYYVPVVELKDAQGNPILDANGNVQYQPQPNGDASTFTAEAAAATALAGDNTATAGFLTALLNYSWDSNGNPIRHPDIKEYISNGQGGYTFYRNSPMTEDSFGGIMAACYFAYTSSASSQQVKDLARQLVGKFINYLVVHQWWLIPDYKDFDFASVKIGTGSNNQYYQNLYNTPTPPQDPNDTSGRIAYKGPESYLLAPPQRYELQEVASKMGFDTSDWQIWAGGLPATVLQGVTDYVAGPVGAAAGRALDYILQRISFSVPYDFKLGSTDFNLGEIKGAVTLSIPDSLRQHMVSAFSSGVTQVISESDRVANLLTLQSGELFDLALNPVLDLLKNYDFSIPYSIPVPPGLSGLFPSQTISGHVDLSIPLANWRDALTSSLQQVMPWLDGSWLAEAATFAGVLRLPFQNPDKIAIGVTDLLLTVASAAVTGVAVPPNVFNASVQRVANHITVPTDSYLIHLIFWPTEILFETRPEMVDVLESGLGGALPNYVADFHARLESQGKLSNNNGQWAWLANDQAQVNQLLAGFAANPAGEWNEYRWPEFAWQTPTYGKNDAGAIVYKWHAPTLDDKAPDDPTLDLHKPPGVLNGRIDFLILQELQNRGVPKSFTQLLSDDGSLVAAWGSHWADILKGLADSIIEAVTAQASRGGGLVSQFVDQAGHLIQQVWTQAGDYLEKEFDSAGHVALTAIQDGKQILGGAISATATDVANIMKNVYGQTDQDVGAVLQGLGNGVDQVTTVLQGVFKDADGAVAQTLSNLGVSPSDIALALKDVYGDADTAAATVLNSLKVGAGDIAAALKNVYRDADAAAATVLHDLGARAGDIASALESLYGDTDQAAAGALHAAGVAAADIAQSLAGVFKDTDQAVANWLNQTGVGATEIAKALLTLSPGAVDKDVAQILNQVGVAPTEIAGALMGAFRAAGETGQLVASALHDAGLGASQIAQALKGALNAADQDVATLLHGAGVGAADITGALGSVFHETDLATARLLNQAGVGATDIAKALSGVLGDTDHAVTNWLVQAGVAPGAIAGALNTVFNDGAQAVADLFSEVHLSPADIASGLHAAFGSAAQDLANLLKGARLSPSDIASGLHNFFGSSAQDVANLLKGAHLSPTDIASGLHNFFGSSAQDVTNLLKGAHLSPSDIAGGLNGFFGSSAQDVANLLNGAHLSASDIAGGLKGFFGSSDQQIVGLLHGVSGTPISPSAIATAVKSAFPSDSGKAIADLLNGVQIPADQIVSALPDIGENVGQIADDITDFVTNPTDAGKAIVKGFGLLGLADGGPTPEQEAAALAAAYNISYDEALQIVNSV